MKKEDRQIEWIQPEHDSSLVEGYYKGEKIIALRQNEYGVWKMYLVLDQICEDFYHRVGIYTTLNDAKRGAERFLKRLQEAVK